MTDEDPVAALAAWLPALLRAMDTLAFVARFMHPPEFAAVLRAAGDADGALRAERGPAETVDDRLADIAGALGQATDHVLEAFATLRGATDLTAVFRALRGLPRAREALWPLREMLPPVSRHFLDPERRLDAAVLARLARADPGADAGVFHVANDPGERGGYSVYAPEAATGGPLPLVMALHGGSGHGRSFLWSWLAAARAEGAIVVAPTSLDRTWSLTGDDRDTPNLMRILDAVRARWPVDEGRLLLTGMSDGGTFSYLSGLESGSPFTHLAPIAASFHPILVQMADADRLRGLPVYLIHGALDWMFPIDVAREANAALSGAGARVVFHEIDTLSHSYPAEMNAPMLDWLAGR